VQPHNTPLSPSGSDYPGGTFRERRRQGVWKLPDLEKEIEELKELYKTADEKKRKEIEERLEELMKAYGIETYIEKHGKEEV